MKKTGSDPFISRYLLSTGQRNAYPTKERARQTGIASAVRIKESRLGKGTGRAAANGAAATLIQNKMKMVGEGLGTWLSGRVL